MVEAALIKEQLEKIRQSPSPQIQDVQNVAHNARKSLQAAATVSEYITTQTQNTLRLEESPKGPKTATSSEKADLESDKLTPVKESSLEILEQLQQHLPRTSSQPGIPTTSGREEIIRDILTNDRDSQFFLPQSGSSSR